MNVSRPIFLGARGTRRGRAVLGAAVLLAALLAPGADTVASPWTPAEISTALWLDASDSSKVTRDTPDLDEDVSQWSDKSGNVRNATQGTDACKPLFVAGVQNGLSIIRFNGSSEFFEMGTGLDWMAGQDHAAFIVAKTSTYNNLYGARNKLNGASSLHVGFNVQHNSYRVNYWDNNWESVITANFSAGNFNILNFQWDSGANKYVYANGKSEAIHPFKDKGGVNGSAGTIAAMSGGGRIVNVVGQGYWGGDIGEIVMINSIPSAADRQKIEGYLAHKWGLAGYLDAGHPYKNAAPESAKQSKPR